jgi:alpha-ribazole phosphatase
MKSYIHLVRHGTTEGNIKGWFYGHSNISLAHEGIREVELLNACGVYPKPDNAYYYTSGLLRAEQTFSIIYGQPPRIKLDELKEMFFGEYELKTHEDLKDDPVYISWRHDRTGLLAPPGGESPVQFIERVSRGLDIIREGHFKEETSEEINSVVVCHGGVICVIMTLCFDDATGDIFKWMPEPGRGYTITFDDGLPLEYKSF